ncbi:MAG TPA: 7-cyano-7-deazaguanine synthase [Ohtaekwangia sp.]|uniref:7-cyano-7-deazaguanine synthase n=1 Tax=Ohtaekwangia sp. TaxID=2066019 RepID=UPI002F91D82D
MKLVTLVSGGIDSTLMSILAKDQGFELFPLFINYGQLNLDLEWKSCRANHAKFKLGTPQRLELSGFGEKIKSGLTTKKLRVLEDAFLPGRNSLFLLTAASYAYQIQSKNIAIGLLSDRFKLFPDQSKGFIKRAERFLSFEMDYDLKVLAPLMRFNKAEVVELAKAKGITKTYSCHAGTVPPCGGCIACKEIEKAMKTLNKR